MTIPETTKRFIVYYDIMGFKDLVYRNDHSFVSGIMDKLCNHIDDFKKWSNSNPHADEPDQDLSVILPVMFSDSVLFITRGNTVEDARSAIFTASTFLYCMFEKGIPVKGSIAYGLFSADFEKSKFFGRPLVDAYKLADETNFYGSIIHHTAENKLNEFDDGFCNELIYRSPIPMKKAKVTHTFINWTEHLREKDLESFLSPLYTTVSGNVRGYVENTLNTYKGIS